MKRKRFGCVEIGAIRTVQTPWGWAGLAASEQGLICCSWPWPDAAQTEEVLGLGGRAASAKAREIVVQAADWLLAFFTGSCREMAKIPLDGRIFSDWQRKVYEVVRRIPFGEVRSYGWVSGECGKAGAARAVGQALARNPLPLFIPCHRVVYGDGRTGSYSCNGSVLSGADLKRQLIAWEQESGG